MKKDSKLGANILTARGISLQIAGIGGDFGWHKPGVLCVDPETGIPYRATGSGWRVDRDTNGLQEMFDATSGISLDRAKANGPELQDTATLGVLLGGDGEVWRYYDQCSEPNVWLARITTKDGRHALNDYTEHGGDPTKAIAIGKAYLNSIKG